MSSALEKGKRAMIRVKKQSLFQAIADSINSYNMTHSDQLPALIQDETSISYYDWTSIANGALFTERSRFVICDICYESVHHFLQNPKYLSYFPKDKHYLLITNGLWNKEDFGIDLSYDIVHWSVFFFLIFWNYSHPASPIFWFDRSYSFDQYKLGSFVCLAGYEKPNRDYLVKEIMSRKGLGNFMLRYAMTDIRYVKKFNDVIGLDIKHAHHIFPKEIMDQFCYELVVETNSYDVEEFHPTEKICKPLLVGMPFVVAGSYRFLHNLRKMGFKTYDSLWSEEYDEIKNHEQRIDSLLRTCEYLATFDWSANRSKLIEIAWHNSNVFRNLQSTVERDIKNFIEKVQQGLEISGYRY